MDRFQKAAEFAGRLGKVAAEEVKNNAYGINNIALQQNLPISERRKATDQDEKLIQAGESRWFPRIFSSYGTPAHELLSSPGKGAILHGLGGALLGSLGGALLGSNLGEAAMGSNTLKDPNLNKILGAALIGGLGLGGLGSIGGYYSRKANNEGIKDLMLRLPYGATKRDLLSDPVYNRDEAMRRLQSIRDMNNFNNDNAYSGLRSRLRSV